MLKTSDFDYELPDELIAQKPAEKRNSSRLLVLDRKSGKMEHRVFGGITDYLGKNDILVLNNTKVIPARLYGVKYGGEARIEVLLDRMIGDGVWRALIRPAKRLSERSVIEFGSGFYAEVREKNPDGSAILYFASVDGFEGSLKKFGNIPLPPYIKRKGSEERYQTVYARMSGATAAPTAGLHFTNDLLDKISAKKVFVTLHTGYGTFAPVREEFLSDHKMHEEAYEVNEEAFGQIAATRSSGGRVVAVGTTSLRLLESANAPGSGTTRLFIYPGYRFKVVDALVTNFHLPKSTLMMLVCAFAGTELIKKAYAEAIKERYRFFSFGDAMLIK